MASSLRRLLSLGRIPLALLGVAFFFTFYNRFILDTNLKNLKSSLSVLDKATGVGQAEAALLLVDQTLTAEMTQDQVNLESVAALQYAQGALASDELDRPVDDAQIMVEKLAAEKGSARNGVLATLDGIVTGTQSALHQLALLPRQVGQGPGSQEIDTARLHQALLWERRGRFLEAAEVYEELLKSYPKYAGQGALRLRLGYAYQRLQSPEKVERICRDLIRQSRRSDERAAAGQMLIQLHQTKDLEKKANALEKRLVPLGSGPERQRLGFELGQLWLKLYRMDKAAEAFRLAALSDPEGEWVNPSLFKEGWALKSSGRFDEALRVFQEVIRRNPTGPWGATARLQTAETYKALGQVQQALSSYEQILKESKDPSFMALALAHAGSTALFELKDPIKAKEYFGRLAAQFPASEFSTIERDLARLQDRKATLWGQPGQSLMAGAPLFGWGQRTLPVFVQVFADRLAKYMDGVGETELTRKYTGEEFQKIVLERVQALFPGQIRDVTIKIHPDGYVGSGIIRVGPLSFSVEGRLGVEVANERPHVIIHELRVWKVPVMESLRKQLASQINKTIDTLRLPVKVTEYETREDYCWISVERVK